MPFGCYDNRKESVILNGNALSFFDSFRMAHTDLVRTWYGAGITPHVVECWLFCFLYDDLCDALVGIPFG